MFFRRSINIIEQHFEEYILRGQEILKDNKINALVMMIIKAHFSYKNDYDTFEANLIRILGSSSDSLSKWNSITKELGIYERSDKIKRAPQSKYSATELCLKEIKLKILK